MNTRSGQPLTDLAELNPRTDVSGLTADTQVSFIPMADVSNSGKWIGRQERRLDEVRIGYTPFADNDLLFAKITPCMENGKGAHVRGLTNGIGFGSTEFHVLRARSEHSARFIFHWLQAESTRTRAVAFMGGSAGQQRVQPGFFGQYRIPEIPPAEQIGIAAVLDTVDQAISETEAVLAKLKQIRTGLLHDLLTRGLDENGELRDPEAHPEQFRDSTLGWVPCDWECQALGDCCDWFSGGTPNRARPAYWSGMAPLLTPKDMKSLALSDTSEHVSEEAAQSGSRLMPPETVFIVVRGMILAHTFPVCLSAAPFAFNQDIKAIRGRGDLTNRFLALWFSSNADLFMRRATEATHGTKKLDTPELHRIEIGVPSGREQEAIIERVSVFDQEAESEIAIRNKLSRLKSGLMADLLTGRVRVPPDLLDVGP